MARFLAIVVLLLAMASGAKAATVGTLLTNATVPVGGFVDTAVVNDGTVATQLAVQGVLLAGDMWSVTASCYFANATFAIGDTVPKSIAVAPPGIYVNPDGALVATAVPVIFQTAGAFFRCRVFNGGSVDARVSMSVNYR